MKHLLCQILDHKTDHRESYTTYDGAISKTTYLACECARCGKPFEDVTYCCLRLDIKVTHEKEQVE